MKGTDDIFLCRVCYENDENKSDEMEKHIRRMYSSADYMDSSDDDDDDDEEEDDEDDEEDDEEDDDEDYKDEDDFDE